MAKKKGGLFVVSHAHPVGELLEFDLGHDVLDDTDPVVAKLYWQTDPTAPIYLYPDFDPVFGVWSYAKDQLFVTPGIPGTYTLVLRASVHGRPISFRSHAITVTP